MRERGVSPDARPLPLAPPTAGPVLVAGAASRVAIDGVMTMVVPSALYWNSDRLPPLRFKHGEVAGEILSLAYNVLGSELRIEARVDHELARRCPAFSVAFVPCAYTVVDRGGQAFHVRVTKARLDEISLTDVPAPRSALVERRCPAMALPACDRYRGLAQSIRSAWPSPRRGIRR